MAKTSRRVTGRMAVLVGLGLMVAVLGMAHFWLSWSTKLPAGQTAKSEQVQTDGSMHELRWLADRSNCPPVGTSLLMAGCIAERLDKARFKARLYKGMYDDLKNLDREYFRRLHEEGLVPMTTHVPK